jgi:hypothetical protein
MTAFADQLMIRYMNPANVDLLLEAYSRHPVEVQPDNG